MPVHFGGHPCKMDEIVNWAKKNVIVIEDCAETCGGYYKNKKLGTWGDYSCLVLKKKMMTTGDGGMICTNNSEMAKKLKSLSFHGWDKDPPRKT